MPVTTLDAKSSLIVIDLQKGLVGLPTAQPTNEVVKHAGEAGTTQEIIKLLNKR